MTGDEAEGLLRAIRLAKNKYKRWGYSAEFVAGWQQALDEFGEIIHQLTQPGVDPLAVILAPGPARQPRPASDIWMAATVVAQPAIDTAPTLLDMARPELDDHPTLIMERPVITDDPTTPTPVPPSVAFKGRV